MPKQTTLPPGQPSALSLPSPEASVAPAFTSARLLIGWNRTRTARALLLSFISAVAGMLLMRGVSPLLPSSALIFQLVAHASPIGEGGRTLATVWLRLLWHRLPWLLLLAAAGLTRFSGALTSAVLTLRGLSDGAAGYCLYALWQGQITVVSDGTLPAPGRWLVIFAGASLAGLFLRAILAAKARWLASILSPLPGSSQAGGGPDTSAPAQLRALLWPYATVTLAVIGGQMVLEGLYVILISFAF